MKYIKVLHRSLGNFGTGNNLSTRIEYKTRFANTGSQKILHDK